MYNDEYMKTHGSDDMQLADLVYDWDRVGEEPRRSPTVEIDDETLRDGLQSPTITQPRIAQKIELLHKMVELGIQAADIGLPGAGPRAAADVTAIAREIADKRLPISANCAARTMPVDVTPIIEASNKAGIPLEVSLFIGSSPIRQYVEDWSLDHILRTVETAVTYAVEHELPVMIVTEDTTRSRPEPLRQLYRAAIACGARRICCADTVGFATPHATRQLIRFAREIIESSGESIQLDWHGHSDRGLGIANAIAAIDAGADRIHATAIGIGERCGNVPMEVLLVNLRLLGYIDNDLTRLASYCQLVSDACGVPIPHNHPVVGRDAFRTSTGVHAAAVIKAMKKDNEWLIDHVYSSVPAQWVAKSQCIEVGPMSGAANAIHWLESRGYKSDPALVSAIVEKAKHSDHVLEPHEIEALIQRIRQ